MKAHQLVFRVLVIDDTTAIHEDFRKILVPPVASAPQVDALAAAIFGEASAAPPPVKFQLDFATQGQAGLALVQDALREGRPYALAFVDMRMPPGWDGLETITHLWSVDPYMQTVICTAYSDHSCERIGERLGPSDRLLILKKPFDQIEILQLSHALTRKWQLARLAENPPPPAHAPGPRTREPWPSRPGNSDLFAVAFRTASFAQAIISLDESRVVAANPAFERMLGMKYDPNADFSLERVLEPFTPDDRQDLHNRLTAGDAVYDHPCTFAPDPRRQRRLLCSSHPLALAGRRCALWIWREDSASRVPRA